MARTLKLMTAAEFDAATVREQHQKERDAFTNYHLARINYLQALSNFQNGL
jgi:hypothetical protein